MGDDIIAFGPFQLNRRRCELLKHGVPVPMGSRAIAILIELTRSAGEIVSHRDLLRRVWHRTVVEDGTVRVHVAQLRKILRQADPGGEYIRNVTGRGYRFVLPVSSRGRPSAAKSAEAAPVRKLPLRQPPRHDSIAYLRELLVTNAEALRKYAGAPNDKTLEDMMWARAAVEGALDEVLTDLGRAEVKLRAFQTTLHGGQEPLIARMATQVSQAIARITVDWVSANEIEIGSVHESFTR